MGIRELLDLYGIPYAGPGNRHYRQGWVNIRCPYCGGGSYKFGIGEKRLGGFCWSCGKHSVKDTLLKINHRIHPDDFQRVWKGRKVLPGKPFAPRGVLKTPQTVPLTPKHAGYLTSRRFDPKTMQRLWGVQSIPPGTSVGKLPVGNRIYIPISAHRKTVAWQARATFDTDLRYISPPDEMTDIPIKETVYGMDHVSHTAVICEGVTDVWRVGPGAVCTYGTSYTDEQVDLLGSVARRVVCFDNEPVAQRKADMLVNALGAYPGQTFAVQLESGSDPDNCDESELNELRKYIL